jgi:putative Mg2+ transporter-C (MgtC) family protein
VLAAAVAVGHFLVVYGYPPLLQLLRRGVGGVAGIRVHYVDGQGVLREILQAATQLGFSVLEVNTEGRESATPTIDLVMRVSGRVPANELVSALAELDGVTLVGTLESDE